MIRMTLDSFPTSLLSEFREVVEGAKLPRIGSNSLAPDQYTPEGLQRIGEFVLRTEVLFAVIIGIIEAAKVYDRRPRGRPKVEALASMDARRAFRLWETVQNLRDTIPAQDIPRIWMSNRHLIETQQRVEQRMFSDEPTEWIFPKAVTFETLE